MATDDATTTHSEAVNEDKTAAASASIESKDGPSSESPLSGDKRKADEDSNTAKSDPSTAAVPAAPETKPKKAKIAMPPSVSSNVMNAEKYKLEAPPPEDNTNEADVGKKITTSNLMLFGLHPLIKETPLRAMLEDYGSVQAITVRSAFASRYGHVSFATVEEARRCYVAIHGAKLLHKTFLVQPSMASAVTNSPTKGTSAPAPVASAGAAASAAAAAKTDSSPAGGSAGVATTSA